MRSWVALSGVYNITVVVDVVVVVVVEILFCRWATSPLASRNAAR